ARLDDRADVEKGRGLQDAADDEPDPPSLLDHVQPIATVPAMSEEQRLAQAANERHQVECGPTLLHRGAERAGPRSEYQMGYQQQQAKREASCRNLPDAQGTLPPPPGRPRARALSVPGLAGRGLAAQWRPLTRSPLAYP